MILEDPTQPESGLLAPGVKSRYQNQFCPGVPPPPKGERSGVISPAKGEEGVAAEEEDEGLPPKPPKGERSGVKSPPKGEEGGPVEEEDDGFPPKPPKRGGGVPPLRGEGGGKMPPELGKGPPPPGGTKRGPPPKPGDGGDGSAQGSPPLPIGGPG
ncbi:hypothetical protein [Thermicanus aegyptius]|uniref:hypothetical protein n=1 Tax=Thermicanus aegyptius TaxID=94009 RepID=UPI00048B4A70|nr:hypothetical protein [Thermicanus aegyptius]